MIKQLSVQKHKRKWDIKLKSCTAKETLKNIKATYRMGKSFCQPDSRSSINVQNI